MPNTLPLVAAAASLLLAGCGPKALVLADDPVEKAATCGVVAAAEARAGQAAAEVAKPLPLEAQGRVLHYALLAGAAAEPFSQDRVAAVVERMPAIGDSVTSGQWQPLVASCAAAYPQSVAAAVTLPTAAADAQLACYTLAAFMDKALAAQGDAYVAQLADYGAMRRKLDERIGTRLTAQGKDSAAAQSDDRGAALGAAARLGPPIKVMAACMTRFG